jgi:hypothetical protein
LPFPVVYLCMFRFAAIFILVLFLFGNCKKETIEQKYIFSVSETSADSPSYNITYTSDKSGGTTTVSSSAAHWSSSTIILEPGQFISMKVDCTAPVFEIKLSVYVNGYLWDSKTMHNPISSTTISGNP